jgi:UDP-N-acetylglucosamine 2-epimerase (non-hydrolysing)
MEKKKILTVVGTRPELIKLAPVVRQIERRDDTDSIVVFSGQHRELLEQASEAFGLEPDHHCRLERRAPTLDALLAELLCTLSPIIDRERPDAVIGQGDTTTALAAGMTAFHARVPFAHVEAGLRSNDLGSPFPEEANRRLLSTLAHWHFAPTELARRALEREAVDRDSIEVTGNTVIDAARFVAQREASVRSSSAPVALVTMHRRENFGARAREMLSTLDAIIAEHPDWRFVFIKHLNPRIRALVDEYIAPHSNLVVCEPVAYGAMIALLRDSELVMTDSGGLQEEAAALDTPVLVLRDNTERMEGVHAGCAVLGTTRPEVLGPTARRLLASGEMRRRMAEAACPYGDGRAAQRIVARLTRDLAAEPHDRETSRPISLHRPETAARASEASVGSPASTPGRGEA